MCVCVRINTARGFMLIYTYLKVPYGQFDAKRKSFFSLIEWEFMTII